MLGWGGSYLRASPHLPQLALPLLEPLEASPAVLEAQLPAPVFPFSKSNKMDFGYFDPETNFLDNENK